MKVTEEKDGTLLMVSDGSPTENNVIVVLIEMLSKCDLSDEDFNGSFGHRSDDGVAKNFIYIPCIDIVKI